VTRLAIPKPIAAGVMKSSAEAQRRLRAPSRASRRPGAWTTCGADPASCPRHLGSYEHLRVDSPYRMRFAIYVRKGERTYDGIDEVPEQLRKRMLTVRSFDRNGMMLKSELVDGPALEGAIERLFADPGAEYLHVHFAAPGCYAARIERA
jgi:Protein of unknown function (DUF1203)